MKLLSICIPAFNRLSIFKISLRTVLEAVQGQEDKIDIIISDNCSNDDLWSMINELNKDFEKITIKYYKNDENLKSANIQKSVSYANTEYSWIIGSDDFLTKNHVSKVVNTLEDRKPDFLFGLIGNYSINLLELNNCENIINNIEKSPNYRRANPKRSVKKNAEFRHFIAPKFNNVYFGAMMCSVFKTDLWKRTLSDYLHELKDSGLFEWYPHVAIYAKGFMRSKTVFINSEVIIAGDGVREWANEGLGSKWDSNLPFILMISVNNIIKYYRKNKLSLKNYLVCSAYQTIITGHSFMEVILHYLRTGRFGIGISRKILFIIFFKNFLNPFFHMGIIRSFGTKS